MLQSLQKHERAVFWAITAWLGIWLWVLRLHFLDDALINLRHAELFVQHGFITYDGITKTCGISSLLGVGIWAAFYYFVQSIWVSKILSCVFYLLFLAIIFTSILSSQGYAKSAWITFLVISISPMALRWLTDGMETSLVILICALLAQLVHKIMHHPTRNPVHYILYLSLGAVLILLRVEYAIVIAASSLAIAYTHWKNDSHGSVGDLIKILFRESHLSIGVFVGFGLAYLISGQIVPDPAIAKAVPDQKLMDGVFAVWYAMLGGLSLGAGLLGLWLATFVACVFVHKKNRQLIFPTVIINTLFMIVFLMICIKGQQVQGIRHVLWALFYSIFWNLITLNGLTMQYPKDFKGLFSKKLLSLFSIGLILIWTFEGYAVARISTSHSDVIVAMDQQNLEKLEGEQSISFDIGFFSYYSKAKICDMMGVVNGREVAEMDEVTRLHHCANSNATTLFVNEEQFNILAAVTNFEDWSICHQYHIDNVIRQPPHFLIVKPSLKEAVCPNPIGIVSDGQLQID